MSAQQYHEILQTKQNEGNVVDQVPSRLRQNCCMFVVVVVVVVMRVVVVVVVVGLHTRSDVAVGAVCSSHTLQAVQVSPPLVEKKPGLHAHERVPGPVKVQIALILQPPLLLKH
jgi:hypothetical protein